mgnify:CR=1 FL=1
MRGCKACFLLLRDKMLAAPHDATRGYLFVAREGRRAAGVGDPRPVARVLEGDWAKVSLLVLSKRDRELVVEHPWVAKVRDEGDGWLSGTVGNELRGFDPKVLELGDRVMFRREHVVNAIPEVALTALDGAHRCKLCDAGAGPPRMPEPDDGSVQALENVRRWGWHVLQIEEGEETPAFVYTIGAQHSFGVPDVVVSGLDEEVAFPLLNRLVDGQRARGARPTSVTLDDVFEDAKAMLVPLEEGRDAEPAMTWARWFYEGAAPCVQLVWADARGVFPTEPGCEPWVREAQQVEEREAKRDDAAPAKAKKRRRKKKQLPA